MIDDGEPAPTFDLPAYRDGSFDRVSLEEFLGDEVVILAFYPGDFNPGCSNHEADLEDLDLFTMQKDVTILAISADSVFSHRAFAREYNIKMPLLSDLEAEVAREYGVAAADTDGYLTRRAVVVIEHTETVEYTWMADDIEDSYDTTAIRDAIEGVGSHETALARYRVGHARYMEGRRAFTSAMNAYVDKEWMMAQGDFERACDEFDEAREEFDTSVRFSEDETATTYFERAESKSEALWRAADWLADSANAFSSGEGAKAESMRSDAEAPLEAARDIHEPPDPDEFPPDEDPADTTAEEPDRKAYLEEDADDVDTTLDLEEPASEDADGDGGAVDDTASDSSPAGETPDRPADETTDPASSETQTDAAGQRAGATDSTTASRGEPQSDSPSSGHDASPDDDTPTDEGEAPEIDDAEIEEIAAELEEQTEAANQRNEDPDVDDNGFVTKEVNSAGDDQESAEASEDTVDIDLNLTDPNDDSEEENGE